MRLFIFLFLTTLAFTCVSVSAQGWDGPIFHIVGSDGYRSYTFNINGEMHNDPALTLIKGQTYQFSIDFINDGTHPFGFASINTGNDVEALGAIGNAWCKTTYPNAFITTDTSNPCIVNYTANNDAFYRCAYHPDMIGKLTVITPTPTTTTATTTTTTTTTTPTTTTTAPPTPTPTPTPDPTIDNSTSSSTNITIFHVIGNNGTNSYIFNISGVAVENPSFDLVLGQTYQFSIDYINDPAVQVNRKPHPFGFTTKAGPIVEPLGAIGNANCKTTINDTFITTDVLKPCIVTYVANANTFYQCSYHPRMRGALIVSPPTTSTPTNSSNNNSSTSSPTTSTPSNGTPSTFKNGTIFHIIGNKGTSSYIFNISGVAVENPSFDLVLGETYQFSIDYLNVPTNGGAPHPFGFSRDGGETASVEALGAIGNVNCQTSPPNAFVTTDVSKPCIITYVANVNSFYRCAYHDPMKGALTVIPTNTTNNNPPSSSPTTSTPTNGTPSTFNGTIFHIIGSRASASYIFNISGIAVENPSFDLIPGKTYQFSIDYNNDPATGVPHPFGFSTNGGTAASIENVGAIGNVDCKIMDNAFITTNISKPCIITYTPKVNTFYRCSFHGPMKGALNVIGTAPSSTAGPTPTENPNCVAGVCVNAASSISTSAYLIIIASLIALAATAF